MKSLIPLAIVLVLASAFGFWFNASRGRIKGAKQAHGSAVKPALSPLELGVPFGSRVTLLQFSSAFCSPCRATRALIADITADMSDVVHVDMDAESHLDLVNRLHIISTPTTIILNSAGVEVGRAIGAPKRTQVVSAIASVV
jgi:thiol-disulfide isomerase/thioredoxin